MNFIYCQSCFKKTPQSSDIVKFCSHCGKPFIETTAQTNKPRSNTRLQQELEYRRRLEAKRLDVDVDNDEETDNGEVDDNFDENIKVPHIDKLNIELDVPKETGVPVRSIARNAERKKRQETKRGKFNKKQFWEEYQKQASSIRNK